MSGGTCSAIKLTASMRPMGPELALQGPQQSKLYNTRAFIRYIYYGKFTFLVD
jgi:hypothetical protein